MAPWPVAGRTGPPRRARFTQLSRASPVLVRSRDRLGDLPRRGRQRPHVQDVADEEVVEQDPGNRPYQRAHDRYPEVTAEYTVDGTRQRDLPPARYEREQPGPEVTGRVDGVSGVGTVGHPD